MLRELGLYALVIVMIAATVVLMVNVSLAAGLIPAAAALVAIGAAYAVVRVRGRRRQ